MHGHLTTVMMNVTFDAVSPRGRCRASDQKQYHYLTPTEKNLGTVVWPPDQDTIVNYDDQHRKVQGQMQVIRPKYFKTELTVMSRDRLLSHLPKIYQSWLPIHFPLYSEPEGSSRRVAMPFGRAFKKMVNLQSKVHLRHRFNLQTSDQIKISNVVSDIVRDMGRWKHPTIRQRF